MTRPLEESLEDMYEQKQRSVRDMTSFLDLHTEKRERLLEDLLVIGGRVDIGFGDRMGGGSSLYA
jgi:hypothetical protein